MIENDRQYHITQGCLEGFQKTVAEYDMDVAIVLSRSSVLAEAQLAAYKSEVEVLSEQLTEYENKWESTENDEHHVQLSEDGKVLRYHSPGYSDMCAICKEGDSDAGD